MNITKRSKKVDLLVSFIDEVARDFLDLSPFLDANDLDCDVWRVWHDCGRDLHDVRFHNVCASMYLDNVMLKYCTSCPATSTYRTATEQMGKS